MDPAGEDLKAPTLRAGEGLMRAGEASIIGLPGEKHRPLQGAWSWQARAALRASVLVEA
jgi:hypothetical protein